jgi:DNA polymerase-3 subunit alpha
LELALENLNKVCSEINFNIPTGVFRLPEYEMTEEESKLYSISEDLFYELINRGFEEKISGKVKNEAIYFERLQEEIDVIKRGGFISYFLILRDIINWCATQGIWVGMGRGSAAGSLVSYLLGIVKIDPIHYKLLFSRFLNSGRIGKMVDKEFLIIQLEDKEIQIESNSDVIVNRNGKEISIKASEITINDNLIKW